MTPGNGSSDVLRVRDSDTFDFTGSTARNFEQIWFESVGTTTIKVNAGVFSSGINRVVQRTAFTGAADNRIEFHAVSGNQNISLSTVSFNNWDDTVGSIGVFGTNSANQFSGDGTYASRLFGFGGGDTITGGSGSGNDVVFIGLGNDAIYQVNGSGTDDLNGGGGNGDTLA